MAAVASILRKSNILRLVARITTVLLCSILLFARNYATPYDGLFPDHPDRGIWMDAAYRMQKGEVAYENFRSPFGFFWLKINALSTLFGEGCKGFPKTVALLYSFFAILLALDLRRRFPFFLIGNLYIFSRFAAVQYPDYNVIGELLFVVFAYTVSNSRFRISFVEILISSLVLCVLFHWKWNFLLLASGFLSVRPLRFGVSRNTVLEVLSILLLALVWILISVFLFKNEFVFFNFLKDLSVSFSIKSESVGPASYLLAFLLVLKKFGLYFFVYGFVFWYFEIRRKGKKRVVRESAIFALMIACSTLMNVTNASKWEAFGIEWHALYWLSRRSLFHSSKRRTWIRTLFLLSFLLAVCIPRCKDFYWEARRGFPKNVSTCSTVGYEYWKSLCEGMRLLETAKQERSVLSVTFSNPMNALLKRKSLENDLLHWNFYDSFNEKHVPDLTSIFRDSPFVLEPKTFADDYQRTIYLEKRKLIDPILDKQYIQKYENEYWKLWTPR
ncbi:hypothetical protein [Leptospira ellisii]|uniref:hypothetical protein n=1 Tax=Leptospira ellisii TaxID=2023197 RepID=UPI000C2AF992|nr:hypothetical protein [Leptospira ellisii]PKA04259.1 hypothetical protein CH375_12070 [Leptospira ellisii]